MTCPGCGSVVQTDFAFCPRCGSRLADAPSSPTGTPPASSQGSAPGGAEAAGSRAEEGDRRLVTVLFADLTVTALRRP
jgi:adenylate cyclase